MGLPFVSLFDDLAESIANPPVNRPLARGVGNFGRRVCDGISARPDLYAPTVLQAPLLAVCEPYWATEGYSPPIIQLPYEGGQCELAYRPTGNYERNCPEPVGFLSAWRLNNNVVGPIRGVVGLNGSWFLKHGAESLTPIIDTETGNVLANGGAGGTVACGQLPGFIRSGRDVKIVAVNPQGHTDVCGNPPVDIRPGPTPAPDNGPLPPGTGPVINVRGVPILVLPPVLTLSPTLEIELPDGEINLGGGGNPMAPEPVLPGDDIPGDDLPGGNGDTDFGDPPEGERWVGCCVSITQRPLGSGTIPAAEPESIYPTTIGNIRMKFKPFGSSRLSYDTPLRKREQTTCVWEPVRGLNPTGARVNTVPGYSYVVTPYSVPEEQ